MISLIIVESVFRLAEFQSGSSINPMELMLQLDWMNFDPTSFSLNQSAPELGSFSHCEHLEGKGCKSEPFCVNIFYGCLLWNNLWSSLFLKTFISTAALSVDWQTR